MPAKGAIISPPMDRFLAKVEKAKTMMYVGHGSEQRIILLGTENSE